MRPWIIAVAATAALSLVAAGEPVTPVGTAETAITALDVVVSGVPIPADATVVAAGSFASTDSDLAHNAAGVPFALARVVPVELAGTPVGATEVSSNGTNTASTGDVPIALGPLSGVVNALDLSATAAVDSASALIEGATANVDGIAGLLSLDIDQTDVSSVVSPDQALASQGVSVSGFSLDVGDLLPADVLAQLPIDTVIALADTLSSQLGDQLGGLADAAAAAAATVQATIDDLASALDGFSAANAALPAAMTAVDDAQAAVDDATAQVAALTTQVDDLTADLNVAEGLVPADVAQITSLITEYVDCGIVLDLLDLQGNIDALVACIQGQLDAAQTELDGAQAELDLAVIGLSTAEGIVDQLTTAIDDAVATLTGLIGDLERQLDTLLDTLVAIIGDLDGVLAAIADGQIADVGTITVGSLARAADVGTEATVNCSVDHVSIAGVDLGSPSCEDPLTLVNETFAGALGTVTDLLRSLPGGDVVPAMSMSMFEVDRSTGTSGAYRTASASVTGLRFELPSVELTDLVDGLIADISLGDVTTIIEGAIDQLTAAVPALPVGLVDVDAITGAVDGLGVALPGVGDLEALIADVIAGLPTGDLPEFATPGLSIAAADMVTRAEYAPGAPAPAPVPDPAPVPNPAPSPNPAPVDDPDSLPATGAGFALTGLASLAGGFALRRRIIR